MSYSSLSGSAMPRCSHTVRYSWPNLCSRTSRAGVLRGLGPFVTMCPGPGQLYLLPRSRFLNGPALYFADTIPSGSGALSQPMLGSPPALRFANISPWGWGHVAQPLRGSGPLVAVPYSAGRVGGDMGLMVTAHPVVRPGPLSCPYSPKCLEEEFCELRMYGILGSSH
jgi:hypothetical protein